MRKMKRLGIELAKIKKETSLPLFAVLGDTSVLGTSLTIYPSSTGLALDDNV